MSREPEPRADADHGHHPGNGDRPSSQPLLVEDVLLLLFQPDSGAIAGEESLYYILGGAVLADLADADQIEADERRLSTRVSEAGGAGLPDVLLEPAMAYIAQKPRDVQSVLAAIGPPLRAHVLDRLVERGDLTRRKSKILGILPSTTLALGSDRRATLISRVKATLLDGEPPTVRTAASIALLSASGTLPQFHSEISWSGDVYTRGKELEHGNWGASAVSSAITRTMNAVIINAVVAATVLPRP